MEPNFITVFTTARHLPLSKEYVRDIIKTNLADTSFCLVWPLPPTRCRCTRLMLHLITLGGTQTLGRIPLDEGSVHRRDLYLTTHTIHVHVGITNRNSSKRTVVDPRRRSCGHRHRGMWRCGLHVSGWG